MSLPDDFAFSQSALQDYVDCPRRFELRCVRRLDWPAPETQQALEYEEQTRRGEEFHHLLHQHAMGVPVEALEATIDEEVTRRWWRNYLEWQAVNLPAARYAELVLTTPLAGRRLMAKYDVVARTDDDRLVIVDWKTGAVPRPAKLVNRLQTIVYPYVLSRAGGWLDRGDGYSARPDLISPDRIRPDRIRMIYWYADEGRTIEFGYNEERQREAEERLARIVGEIVAGGGFPQTSDERACRFCRYRSLCERGVEAGSLAELDEAESDIALTLDLDDLEEIAF